MIFSGQVRRFFRLGGMGLILLAGLMSFGCATQTRTIARRVVTTENSPVAEVVTVREAWALAEAFVASHPRSGILVGSGDSMLPLYPDRTVLVVQPIEMSELQRGMTVVFIGDRGRPVAHALIEKTPRGWIAMGAANRESDDTRVQFRNYIGTVVRAYFPIPGLASRTLRVPAARAGERLAVTELRTPAALFAGTLTAE
jgi:hypothetical protein